MEKINLMIIFRIAVKNIKILIITGVLIATVVLGYCEFFATPKYSATGSLLVTNGALMSGANISGSILNNNDILASINLVDTVKDILQTNGIYKKMEKSIEGKYTYDKLFSMTTVNRKNEKSLFIDISITATDKKEAITLVNEYLKLVPDYINNYIPNSEVAVSIADKSVKVFPNTGMYVIASAFFSMLCVFIIILLFNLSNTVIRSKDDLTERFDIPVLGIIPSFEKSRMEKQNYYNYYGK